MAEDAKEATGSMGDDTPLAVLSDKYRPLYHFFRQNFSQVTNPPIDSLRENKVMSLKTRFGNLGNILDFDTLTKDKMLFAGSETGMIELNEKKILSKGRLGPGEILGIRIEKGKVFSNDQIKDYLAKEYKHFNSQIIDLDEKLQINREKFTFKGEDLRLSLIHI